MSAQVEQTAFAGAAGLAPRGDERLGWTHWRVLFAAWAVWALDAIDFLCITFVLVDISRTFDVSLSATSLLMFATYGVRWIGGLLFGSLSDRIGRKKVLLITLAWFTVGAVLTGLAPSFGWMIAFRLLLGFGMAPGFSVGATLVAETWPERKRALGIGIHDSGWGIGGIGAALIYTLVYPYTGWRGVFFVGVIPAILLGLFILLCIPESPVWDRQVVRAPRTELPALTLFRRHARRVAYLTLLMLSLFLANWPMIGLFPTYLKSLHFPVAVVGTLTTTAAIGQVCGFACSGLIAERLGRRNGLTAMLLSGAVAMVVLTLTVQDFWVAEVLSFIAGALLVGAAGIWGLILTEHLPTDVRASGVGFLYNIGAFAGGLAPFLVLSLRSRLGLDFGVALAGATVVTCVLACIILRFARETKGVSLENVEAI